MKKMMSLFFLLLMFIIGCGSGSDAVDTNPELLSAEITKTVSSLEEYEEIILAQGIQEYTISGTLGGYDSLAEVPLELQGQISSLKDIWELVKILWRSAGLADKAKPFVWVDFYKVTYKQDNHSDSPTLSGLMIKPRFLNPLYKPPILVVTHPTETLRKFSPSVTDPFFDGTMTKPFGLLFATLGYAVVMPDYVGMGENYQAHPYCLESLGKSAATMVDAVRKINGVSYDNSHTYVMGFSEGGYAALATAAYMRSHPLNEYNLKRVSALSGPYDLSGAMRALMLTADRNYPAPYFLPYTINGYAAAYPEIDYLDFSQSVVSNPVEDDLPFYQTLHSMLYGKFNGTQISNFIYTVQPDNPWHNPDKNSYYGPLSIATTKFQTMLKQPDSALNTALSDNTLVRESWYPSPDIDFFFAHYKDDDCVPVGNTEAMQKVWGKYTNVTFSIFDSTTPLSKSAVGSTHAASILQAYVRGMRFILGMPYNFEEID